MLYLIILVILIVLAAVYDFRGGRRGMKFWYNLMLIVLILISGFSYKVGGDIQSYYDSFSKIPLLWELPNFKFSSSIYNPLWIILSSISKTILNDFTLFQIIHALIINTVIFWFIKKNTLFRFTAVLIYYAFLYLYFNMEIMRESVAICIFLIAYPYFKKGKWIKFYFFAFLAFLFHSSAIIVFLFPFLRNIRLNIRNIIILFIAVSTISFLLLQMPVVLNSILFAFGIAEKFYSYYQLKTNFNGMLMIFLLYGLIPFLVITYFRKIKKTKHTFEDMYMIYFALVIIHIPISGFGRLLNYVVPFMVIYFADFLNQLYRYRLVFKFRALAIITIFTIFFIPKILYYTEDTSKIYYNTHKYNLWYPYSSVFAPKEYPYRKLIHSAAVGNDN